MICCARCEAWLGGDGPCEEIGGELYCEDCAVIVRGEVEE